MDRKVLFGAGCRISDALHQGSGQFERGNDWIRMDWDRTQYSESLSILMKQQYQSIEAELSLIGDPLGSQPHQVVFPSFKQRPLFTQKLAGIPVSGKIRGLFKDGKEYHLDPAVSHAVIDHTIGYHDYHWCWRWASLACRSESAVIGVNLVEPVTDPEINENAIWINGRRIVVGEAVFEYSDQDLMAGWTIRSADDLIQLQFKPITRRREDLNFGIVQSCFTQLIGLYNGQIRLPSGENHRIQQQYGLAEKHAARW